MASSPKAVLCRYRYDPLDRLAGATVSGQANALRFYQKNRLATQIQGAVQRTIIQHEDLLLAQQQRIDSATETTLLATDQQRSVLQLLDDTAPRSLAYNPYGHHPAESGLSSLLGFNGEHRDPVTGHYLLGNGYRAFNPVLMRFNSPDSLSPFDEGGINAYAYCEGDPINRMDPSGHMFGFGALRRQSLGRTTPPSSNPRYVPNLATPPSSPISDRRLSLSSSPPGSPSPVAGHLVADVARHFTMPLAGPSQTGPSSSGVMGTVAGSGGGGLPIPMAGTAKGGIGPAKNRINTRRYTNLLEREFSNSPGSANRTYKAMKNHKVDALLLKEHYEKTYGPGSDLAMRYSKELLDAQNAMERYHRAFQSRVPTINDYLYDIRRPQ